MKIKAGRPSPAGGRVLIFIAQVAVDIAESFGYPLALFRQEVILAYREAHRFLLEYQAALLKL